MPYPEEQPVFVDRPFGSNIQSSDPNVAYATIEEIAGFLGTAGKPQSWTTTLITALRKYRNGMNVGIDSGAVVVKSGKAVLENTDGTKFVARLNAGDVTLSTDNLDVGTITNGFYFVYLTGGTAATTSPVQYSTDANAPSGIGTAPYFKIGWLHNTGGAALLSTFSGNISENSIANFAEAVGVGTASIASTGYIPLDDMNLRFVSNGRPLFLYFNGSFKHNSGSGAPIYDFQFDIDGGAFSDFISQTVDVGITQGVSFEKIFPGIPAGTHTLIINVKGNSAEALVNDNANAGNRKFGVFEL